ncbi:catalase-like [Choristoneura fumiferana]|uniref:catalase-like n=1 Tax=Choristoneura fumiferana TaxID=7141 RepID=UPI003D157522
MELLKKTTELATGGTQQVVLVITPMKRVVCCLFSVLLLKKGSGIEHWNATLDLDPASRQLLDFKLEHPRPIGVLTTSAGKPVEVRETVTLNTDPFSNVFFYDQLSSSDHERIPERVVHAKGTGAFGYFEVTHDVSMYTHADVFNGIGKKTPVFGRFSVVNQGLSGIDLSREVRGLGARFYTNEGNLDLIGVAVPVFLFKDPNLFSSTTHHLKRNPKTNLFDNTYRTETFTQEPDSLHGVLWLLSDYGQTNGYRKCDSFTLHPFEVNNKHGESFFVKFNFRSEQGVEVLTEEAARALSATDQDYSTRDLYNAIAEGKFPSWQLEMDVISKHDLTKLNYNPFDLTRLWVNGTYHTVTIGRFVLNRNPENMFKDVEQAALNPGNLVPGIPGPHDDIFKARLFAYRDTQNYRLGINHNNIDVNRPKYRKVYTRDGSPPTKDNMKDAPNYYQNSFNGPVPFVSVARPRERIKIYDRNVVDLQYSADFYSKYMVTEGKRNRLAANIAGILVTAVPLVQKDALRMFHLVDRDLGRRVAIALAAAQASRTTSQPVLVKVDECPTTFDVAPSNSAAAEPPDLKLAPKPLETVPDTLDPVPNA